MAILRYFKFIIIIFKGSLFFSPLLPSLSFLKLSCGNPVAWNKFCLLHCYRFTKSGLKLLQNYLITAPEFLGVESALLNKQTIITLSALEKHHVAIKICRCTFSPSTHPRRGCVTLFQVSNSNPQKRINPLRSNSSHCL